MFVIVARSGTESPSTPGPMYSKIRPRPPRTLSRRSSSRMMSLAETIGMSAPCSRTATTVGISRMNGSPAMAIAMSRPPAPIASMPIPPAVGVCESLPSSVLPGAAKRSRCTWWQIPLPGREKCAPNLAAVLCRNRWSSAFSKPVCSMLWSI